MISFDEVVAARDQIARWLPPTPLRNYPELDQAVGGGLQLWVKHENVQPTGAFKVRNALTALTTLSDEEVHRGVIAASRGNHGLALAWAGRTLGIPVTVCVPVGNNPEKNSGMRSWGAKVIEEGRDYDEAVAVADKLVQTHGFTLIHSTNHRHILAGAGTLALEMLETAPDLEAMVFAVGGGSQAVGALTVARGLKRTIRMFGVQAAGASAIHDSWHRGERIEKPSVETFADGLATRKTYDFTFSTLKDGLAGFVTVTDQQIAEALRLLLRTTHHLAEGAGAAGLAGTIALRDKLTNRQVGIVLSGGNIDTATLRRVLNGEL